MAHLLSPTAPLKDTKASYSSGETDKVLEGDDLLCIPRLLLLSHYVINRTAYLPDVLRKLTEEVVTSFYSSLSTLDSLMNNDSNPVYQIATDHVPFGVDNFKVCEATLNAMIDDLDFRADLHATDTEPPGETRVLWQVLARQVGKTQYGKRDLKELVEILAVQDQVVRRDLFERLR
jgi:hypothetical protein